MPRRTVTPTVGRGQVAPVRPLAPAQTALPDALLVPVDQIVPDPGQPRRHFDEPALAELAESIRQEGVLQPLLVREEGALPDGRTRYVIIAGGRRHRAAIKAGLATVPVIVRAGAEGTELRILQLVENLQREELDALEEALAIRELMQLANLSLEGIAARIGKTKAYVQRRTDLLYDPRLVEAIRRGAINASVAVELRYFSEEQRGAYLDRVAAGERLEVAQLREEKRRARAILFGDAGRRGVSTRDALPSDDVRPVATSSHLPGSYRIDTIGAPTTSSAGRPDTPDISYRTSAGATDPGHNRAVDQGEAYRFDTKTDASTLSDERSGIEVFGNGGDAHIAGDRPTDMLVDRISESTVERWAVDVAEEILKVGYAAENQTLVRALLIWRDAGSPRGWGDALLAALATRLDH